MGWVPEGHAEDHAARHGDGGADEVTIVEAQISDLNHDDADAIHDNVAGEFAAVTEKASPVSADLILIEDSEAANAKKRVQVGNLPGGVPTASTKGDIAVYNGSAWVAVSAPTPATGLIEKANSATVTLQGDAELVTDYVLAADPGGSSGVRWAAVAGGILES